MSPKPRKISKQPKSVTISLNGPGAMSLEAAYQMLNIQLMFGTNVKIISGDVSHLFTSKDQPISTSFLYNILKRGQK